MNLLIILAAQYLYLISLGLAAGYWLRSARTIKRQLAISGVVSAVIGLALTKLAASLFYDPRPFVTSHLTPLIPHAPDNGFPSDHTVLAALVACIIFTQSRRLGLVLLGLAAIIGMARIAARVHSPIDVMASIVIAAISVWLGTFITNRFLAARHRQPADKTP